MKKKKLLISAAVLGLMTLAAAAPYYYVQAQAKAGNQDGTGARFMGSRANQNLTAEETAAFQEKMAANEAQRASRQEAVNQAILNNDYNAWLAVVGSASPIAQKINAANFAQYITLHNLQQEVFAQRKALGLDEIGHRGGGFGRMGSGR